VKNEGVTWWPAAGERVRFEAITTAVTGVVEMTWVVSLGREDLGEIGRHIQAVVFRLVCRESGYGGRRVYWVLLTGPLEVSKTSCGNQSESESL
jgi:hypothetical protein